MCQQLTGADTEEIEGFGAFSLGCIVHSPQTPSTSSGSFVKKITNLGDNIRLRHRSHVLYEEVLPYEILRRVVRLGRGYLLGVHSCDLSNADDLTEQSSIVRYFAISNLSPYLNECVRSSFIFGWA